MRQRLIPICVGAALSLMASSGFGSDLDASDFPEFGGEEYMVPVFTGTDCNLSDWRAYKRSLSPVRGRITAYEDQRVLHDLKVRQFDQKLERCRRSLKCSQNEYIDLKELVNEANLLNSGSRLNKWTDNQIELEARIKEANSSIDRLTVNPSGQCDGQ